MFSYTKLFKNIENEIGVNLIEISRNIHVCIPLFDIQII